MIKGLSGLRVVVSHDKTATCLVWCPWIFSNGDIIYLVWHETLHNHFIEGSCKYMGGELFAVSRNPDTSCDHMRCFWFVTWPHVSTCLKGYANLWVKSLASYHLPYYVWWSLVKCKWRYKVFYMSCDIANHVIDGSCNFMTGSFSWKVTN